MQIEVITGAEMRLIPQPDNIEWPEDSLHVISRDENGELQARMSLVALPHIEGTWLAEPLRGTTAGAKLLSRMEREVKERGSTHVFAFVRDGDDHIDDYLERCGYEPYPVHVYFKELQKCQ